MAEATTPTTRSRAAAAKPAAEEKANMEQIAMANIMKGVHW